MCFTINLSESSRRVFGMGTSVFNVILLFLGLSLVIAGIAIRIKLDSRLELLEDYNPGALPILLMVTGGLLFLTHLVAFKFCYDATYVETRSTMHHRFIVLIIFLCVLCLYVFITEIITLVHSSKIDHALDRGIHNLMLVYISDLESKQRVDTIQLEFACCGSRSYEEWFKISWVNLAYVNTSSIAVQSYIIDGKFIKDDAPFSCCSRFSKFACVHHSVLHSMGEKSQQLTLSKEGCATVIGAYFHSSLIAPTAYLILSVLILQAITISLMRLLQTSIASADEMGDPEAVGAAYCIQTMGVGKDNQAYMEKDETKGSNKGGKAKKGSGDDDDDDDDDDDEKDDDDDGDDDDDEKESGFSHAMSKMNAKSPFKKPKLPWKKSKKDDDGDDDDDKGKGKGKRKSDGGDDDGGQSKKARKAEKKEEKKKAKADKKEAKELKKKDKKEAKKQKKEDKKQKKEDKKQKKEGKKKEKDEKKKAKKEKKEKKKKEKKEKSSKKKEEKKKKKDEKKKKKQKEKEMKKKKKDQKKAQKKAEKSRKKAQKKAEKERKKAAKKSKKKK